MCQKGWYYAIDFSARRGARSFVTYFFSFHLLFQMCSKFSILEKAQNCKGLLPDSWLYLFEAPEENPMHDGLIIVSVANLLNASKKPLRCKSFEGVANRCGCSFAAFDPVKFYEHLGLSPQPTAAVFSKSTGPRERVTPKKFTPNSWTLRELSEKGCGNCENCLRTACSKCDSCVQAKGDVCLRRVSRDHLFRLLSNIFVSGPLSHVILHCSLGLLQNKPRAQISIGSVLSPRLEFFL